jgi:cell division protein FtsW (lipid II flippase)
MQEYVALLSKYFIAICMAVYTLESFLVFRFKQEEARRGIYLRQTILIFFIQFAAFMTLVIKSGDLQYLLFYGIVQLMLFGIIMITDMIYPRANRLLINHICLLLGIGFIILCRLSYQRALKQFVIVILSMVIAMFIPSLIEKWRFLKGFKWVYAVAGIAGLSAVLIYGQFSHGANISFSIFGITFQPSEFVKILFVFYVAASLYESTSFLNIAFTTIFAALHVIILVVSKDLGSALIFFIAYLFMVFVATKNYLYLLLGIGGGIGSAIVAYHYFKHVQVRVQAWLDPWTYIDNQGYQVTQSLFGVGSGSWFGMGLMSGNPDTIPYVEMDSIFSAICEEMGVIFGIMLILICISCFIMMMNMALLIKDNFYRYISYGLGVIYIFQVFLTIGGSIKFIPLTGVTLPLVSYGGSSVMSTLLMFYIVQGLYLIRQKEERNGRRKKRRPNREQRYRRETETIPPEDDLVFLDRETE